MQNLFYRRMSVLVRPFSITIFTIFMIGVFLLGLGADKLLMGTDSAIKCPYEGCPPVFSPECPGNIGQEPCPEVYEEPCPRQKGYQ